MAANEDSGFCVPYTVRLTDAKGWGVFAETAIRRGTLVWRHVPGQYAVYDERSLEELLGRLSHSEALYELTHMFGLSEFPGYLIRILDDGVLINHSRDPAVGLNDAFRTHDVPCVASAHDVARALLHDRFALIAMRDIETGEELTNDYNTDVRDPLYYDVLCRRYGVSWDWL